MCSNKQPFFKGAILKKFFLSMLSLPQMNIMLNYIWWAHSSWEERKTRENSNRKILAYTWNRTHNHHHTKPTLMYCIVLKIFLLRYFRAVFKNSGVLWLKTRYVIWHTFELLKIYVFKYRYININVKNLIYNKQNRESTKGYSWWKSG